MRTPREFHHQTRGQLKKRRSNWLGGFAVAYENKPFVVSYKFTSYYTFQGDS